ncbi:MAG: carbon-nitrogen hydrolase family protein, partial [Fusobacterium sp.]
NCYDIEFPELFRILSLKGAELVICSAVWSKWIQHRWHNSLISGAATNLYFVAGVNTIGTTPKGSVICGDTKVINPFGEVIIKASEDKEEVIYKTIDLDEVKKMREEYPIWKDFRKDMYKDKILDFEK